MIKFFKNIRKSILMGNTTSKYFKYAIGEIILVVIGILIALQINNWNQSRKERISEFKYLQNIHRDLKEQLNYIEEQEIYEKRYIEAANPVITFYNDYFKFSCDSLFYSNITILNSRKTFVTTDPTFIDLISSGNINLIKNDSLKDHIISYYQELERVEKIIQNNNTLIVDQQYADIVQNLGYYYYNQDKGYIALQGNLNNELKNSISKTKNYNTKLAEIAKELLAIPKNQLALMNVINHRHVVSIAHIQQLNHLRTITTDLMDAITHNIEN